MISRIAAWWRTENGVFANIEDVLPHVTLHLPPPPNTSIITPYVIGPASLQSEVIGSSDPAVMRENLLEFCPDYAANLVPAYLHVACEHEPVHDFCRFEGLTTAGAFCFHYERLILPVRTSSGQRLIVTLTQRTNSPRH